MRRHGWETSKANNFTREDVYGQNPNLRGPNGEPSEVLKTKHRDGSDLEIEHHKHGHQFKDDNTHELPHYQAPTESTFLMRKSSDQLLEVVSRVIDQFKVTVRLMVSGNEGPSEWSPWLTFPSESYVETAGLGPVKKDDVIWVEIANVESRKRGRIVPEERINHADEIIKLLQREGVAWENNTEETTRVALV